jgi:hypothetical protein
MRLTSCLLSIKLNNAAILLVWSFSIEIKSGYILFMVLAHVYAVMKMSQQHTTGNEGIEVLENRPFEDNVLGKGRYTNKVYCLQR